MAYLSSESIKRLQRDLEAAENVIAALRWIAQDSAPDSLLRASSDVLSRLCCDRQILKETPELPAEPPKK